MPDTIFSSFKTVAYEGPSSENPLSYRWYDPNRVVNGKPQGGVKTLSFQKGDQIRLRVVSDTADEIHVHGYDLMKDVEQGGTVRFSFPATIEGRFEIELEDAGVQIANLEVRPS